MTARQVELTGGSPWGFRMIGGAEHNTPLRISRVNPGRKASLSGIREGDVITSINGRSTRGVTNVDAHAWLRAQGHSLTLGLNEDKEMSPRRRSIGKGTELKRPSQLLADVSGRATPQAPVYATIRPSPSPLHRSTPLPAPASLVSTPLVQSAAEDTIRIHPTNPFYTTLSASHSSPSKLPIPNGRPAYSYASLDRHKKTEDLTGLRSSRDSQSSGLPYASERTNGHDDKPKSAGDKTDPFSYDSLYSHSNGLPSNVVDNGDPFDTSKVNGDPFEKYLRLHNDSKKAIPTSLSESTFSSKEEVLKRSTVTEEKINKIEEVKTIKKIVLNGSGDSQSRPIAEELQFVSPTQYNTKEKNVTSTGDLRDFGDFNVTEDGLRQNNANREFLQQNENKLYRYGSLNRSKDEQKQRSTNKDGFQYSPSNSKLGNETGEKLSNSVNDMSYDSFFSSSSQYPTRSDQQLSTTAEASQHDVQIKPPLSTATAPAPAHSQPSPTPKRSTTLNKGQVQGFDNQPLPLRDICVKKVARFPYGDKILQELASVSEKLQHITIFGINAKNDAIDEEQKQFAIGSNKSHTENMPYYPLPDVSSIEKVSLPTKPKDSVPPPIKPRKSSLKKNDDALWTGVPTKQEPVYLCLSPSQKMLMEKTNTVITKEDATQLVDMHTKFVDRRGYNEYYDNKDKTQDKERVDMPSAVPFKSQTGSRLLAIIRDPAVTNNISSSMNKHYNKSLDQLQSKYSQSESTFKKNVERFNSSKVAHSFKPIPPPRPRKFSSSLYESDESSDFTDSSLRSIKSERKFFHYSTGALNKEIENDISSIQDMHRRYTNTRDQLLKPASNQNTPRRPSLPQDLCDQQMEYIRQKEKEVEAEIRRLEEMKLNIVESKKGSPKAPVISEKEVIEEKHFDADNYSISRKRDVAFLRGKSPDKEKSEKSKVSSAFSSSQEEIQREKMYSEYMNQMAERQERKQHKIIKITNPSAKQSSSSTSISKSMSSLEVLEAKTNNPIEKEFIWKARERWNKLGIKDPETEDEKEDSKLVYREPQVIEHKIKVIEGGEEKDVQKLPNHLQEFVKLTAKKEGTGSPGESRAGPTAPHAVILCAVLILLIAVVKFFFRLLRNKN